MWWFARQSFMFHPSFRVFSIASAILVCLVLTSAQSRRTTQRDQKPSSNKEEQNKEKLTPLTDEDRSLNPRDMILNQPDFVADLNFFVSEGFGGYGGAERLARKGTKYREESQFWIFVGELGKPAARLFP